MKLLLLLLTIALPIWSNHDIIFIGADGNEQVHQVTRDQYKNYFEQCIKTFTKKIEELPSIQNKQSNWYLSEVSIGIGLKTDIGIGPFKLGAGIRKRFFFER